jgi:DNA-binding NtrC family response regulator
LESAIDSEKAAVRWCSRQGVDVKRPIWNALVVEDDAVLLGAIATFLARKGLRVATAATAAQAVKELQSRPDVVALDVRLPDGDAFVVLEHARSITPAPIRIVISGEASPEDAFRLAQLGVRGYLQKPVSLDDIWAAIQDAAEMPPDLLPIVQQVVGHVPLRQLITSVRNEAVAQAMASARGNSARAARILSVTRQAVQQILQRNGSKSKMT